MSLVFLANNFHFALELMGAVVFLMAAWLTLDTYNVRKEASTMARTIGFGLIAVWQVVHAVNIGSDVISYAGFVAFLIGLFLILASFLSRQELHVQAVLVIPAFALWDQFFYMASTVMLFAIAYLAYRKAEIEFNRTWRPLALGFFLLGISNALAIYHSSSAVDIVFIASHLSVAAGFACITRWVWQYLQLRIRESLVLIFISTALFLSTIVTLAFSTILIGQITSDTKANLLTDARILDLAISGLKQEARAKTALAAQTEGLADAIDAHDFEKLEQIAETVLEEQALGFVTIADRDGIVLMRAHALSRRGDSLFGERAFEEALRGNAFVTVEESPVEKFSIRAGAPVVRDGQPIGAVIAGYPLDNAFVDSIKRIAGLEMFVYQGHTSVAGTALGNDGRTRITGVVIPVMDVASVFDGSPTTMRSQFQGRSFLASYLPLTNGDDKIVGMISAAKSEQDILDIENSTNRLTLITVMLIMLVLSAPMYMFTRRLAAETA
jgi:hypothetical protein